eukprot:TRINITY_DN102975_c0_g1_i1.p1 TRINITY_DN102975_c0_g1~~TRINITY_DN102975_c0_g1_i1.p1  ORF type:complete len:177 (+),score=17.83 TRINITY_DN102975_c0_g1_i1:138-668(+)
MTIDPKLLRWYKDFEVHKEVGLQLANVHTHNFRDRDRKKERAISGHEFGTVHETRQARADRIEAENLYAMLPREAWASNQAGPLHLVSRDKTGGTTFRSHRTSAPSPLVSENRMPYHAPLQGYQEIRPSRPRSSLTGRPKSSGFRHGRPPEQPPRPLSAQEVWSDRARVQMWGGFR